MAVTDSARSILDGLSAAEIAVYLADRFPEPEHSDDADPLFAMLAEILDVRRLRPLVEYLARRARHNEDRVCEMTFHLDQGRLRWSSFRHERIGNVELEHIAAG